MRFKPVAAAVLGVVVLATAVLSGCSSKPTTGNGTAQEVRLNLGDEPPSLDPQRSNDQLSFDVIGQVQEGLVRIKDTAHIEKGSGLAKDWTVSPDGLTYTFTLKDARWSDGQPIKAQDFEFAWKRAMDPRTGSQYNYQLFYIKGGEAAATIKIPQNYKSDPAAKTSTDQQIEAALKDVAVKATDEKTLTVTLSHPTPYFLSLTAFPTYMPSRQDVVEKHGEKYGADADRLVFSGPFKVTTWTHENELILEKNENYWDAATVKLEKVNFQLNVKETNTAINMFEAGDLDSTGIPGDFIPQYKDKGLQTMPIAASYYAEFNTKDPVFKNAKIRKAFSLAIDRKLFTNDIMRNGSLPAEGLVPPSIPGLVDPTKPFRQESGALVPTGAQPDEAKRLLAEGLRELNLQQLPEITLLTNDSATAKKYSQGLQEFWNKNLGVAVKLESIAFKQALQKMIAGQFQVVLGGWAADYLDPMTFLDLFLTGGGNQYAGYANSAYDSLVEGAKRTDDQKERLKALSAAEKMLVDDAPIAPLYFATINWVQKPHFQGFLRFPAGVDFDLKWASVSK